MAKLRERFYRRGGKRPTRPCRRLIARHGSALLLAVNGRERLETFGEYQAEIAHGGQALRRVLTSGEHDIAQHFVHRSALRFIQMPFDRGRLS